MKNGFRSLFVLVLMLAGAVTLSAATTQTVSNPCTGGGTSYTTLVFGDDGRLIRAFGVDCNGDAWVKNTYVTTGSPTGPISRSVGATCAIGVANHTVYFDSDFVLIGAVGTDCSSTSYAVATDLFIE